MKSERTIRRIDRRLPDIPVPDYVPGGTSRTKHSKRLFLQAFAKNNCNIGLSCRIAEINRRTFNRWREVDEAFDTTCFEIEQAYIDNLISLHDKLAIQQGDVRSLWKKIVAKTDDPAYRRPEKHEVVSNTSMAVSGAVNMDVGMQELPPDSIKRIVEAMAGRTDKAKAALDKLVKR